MEEEALWEAFARSGRVEDYLRYCGIDINTGASALSEEAHHGAGEKSPYHDRRSDSAGIRHGGGI